MRAINFVARLLRDNRGATAVEYGLIVSLIVIAAMGAIQTFGTEAAGMWTSVSETIDAVM